MFRTQFDVHERVHQEPGDRDHILYGPKLRDNGIIDLEEIGREDIYAYIQSHADSVDIHVILERFARGDVSALSRVQGAYGDFTQMPKTFAEALNTMIAAEQYFNSLPVDIRAQFDHNFNQFLVSMDQPDFTSRMGITPDVSPTDAVSSAPTPASTPSPEEGA
ncbi:internal scaffolding protein [Sigmofec virus UA08Rod_5448]|uniref:Internal scaffolding protein n=1 Tax=Sigmofec virus UA08Rod_5448 TaxID=2929425 RepID=A0A976N1B4_9VIRU|nr:internal scaffolding protein [Sigmofec virus UA08Rod_5448]